MAWAEELAYGPLSLRPWEFEQLQPHEFYALLKGYQWRQEQQEDIQAYWVSHLLNISGKSLKRNLSPKDLIRPIRKSKEKQKKSDDEQYLRERFKGILED